MKAVAGKSQARKVLARNAAVPVRTRKVTGPQKHVRFAQQEHEESEEEEGTSTSVGETNLDLSSPEFCTILKLADEIKKVKLDPNVLLPKKDCKNTMPCNVNYEPDEKLFRDLIALERPKREPQHGAKSTSSARSLCKRDPEPDYKELLKYSLQPEYNFTRLFVPEVKRPVPQFDGRSIYRLTKRWEYYDPEIL